MVKSWCLLILNIRQINSENVTERFRAILLDDRGTSNFKAKGQATLHTYTLSVGACVSEGQFSQNAFMMLPSLSEIGSSSNHLSVNSALIEVPDPRTLMCLAWDFIVEHNTLNEQSESYLYHLILTNK